MLFSIMLAALRTPYLTIGDRLIALSDSDRRRDERDRGIAPRPPAREDYSSSPPPAKLWWFLVLASALAAFSVLAHGDELRSRFFPIVALLLALLVGILDGRGRFRVARQQYVQAVLAGLASIPLFGVPIGPYAVGYFVGLRLPISYGRNYERAIRQLDESQDLPAPESPDNAH